MSLPMYKPGIPIIYVPTHANGDKNHPDVERGYIYWYNGGRSVFCKFYHKNSKELRTTSCSEMCNIEDVFEDETNR